MKNKEEGARDIQRTLATIDQLLLFYYDEVQMRAIQQVLSNPKQQPEIEKVDQVKPLTQIFRAAKPPSNHVYEEGNHR